MPLIIIRPKNKIPAFPAKAGEKPMVFQLFQPNSEKRLIFQLLQHFQPEWTSCTLAAVASHQLFLCCHHWFIVHMAKCITKMENKEMGINNRCGNNLLTRMIQKIVDSCEIKVLFYTLQNTEENMGSSS